MSRLLPGLVATALGTYASLAPSYAAPGIQPEDRGWNRDVVVSAVDGNSIGQTVHPSAYYVMTSTWFAAPTRSRIGIPKNAVLSLSLEDTGAGQPSLPSGADFAFPYRHDGAYDLVALVSLDGEYRVKARVRHGQTTFLEHETVLTGAEIARGFKILLY